MNSERELLLRPSTPSSSSSSTLYPLEEEGKTRLLQPFPNHTRFSHLFRLAVKKEWSLYYVNYTSLSGHLRNLDNEVQSGRTKEEIEKSFLKLIESEISKVNDFYLKTVKELEDSLYQLKKILLSGNVDATMKESILSQLEKSAATIVDLGDFGWINTEAMEKILDKHDQRTGQSARVFYGPHLHLQPFSDCHIRLGNLLVKFSECSSLARRFLGLEEKEEKVGEGGFQSFQRSTTKYWVAPENILRVKAIISKNLPVYIFTPSNARFPKDPTDSALISSVYYDNPETMESYESRLRKTEAALAIRFRNYENCREVFVERKTHHESWVTGCVSIKERFDLDPSDVYDFVRGTLPVEEYLRTLQQAGKSPKSIEEARKLYEEIQKIIVGRKWVPTMTTECRRTAWQLPGNSRVRVSLDTHLRMIKQNLKLKNDGLYYRDPLTVKDEDIHNFAFAVLEVKLQTHEGVEPPQWVTDLLSSALVQEAPKFSKYIHGCAFLMEDKVPAFPAWTQQYKNVLPRRQQKGFLTSPLLSLRPYEDGEEELDREGDVKLSVHRGEAPPREPTLWERLRNYFLFENDFWHVDGKPVMTRMKVEPKTFFANERTYLHWISICMVIQTVGIALVSFPSTGMYGVTTGVMFVFLSIGFMGYALFVFRWRAARIKSNHPGRYDDFWGPVILFCAISFVVITNMFFSGLPEYREIVHPNNASVPHIQPGVD